jgi:hypothetical protein
VEDSIKTRENDTKGGKNVFRKKMGGGTNTDFSGHRQSVYHSFQFS